VTLRLLESRDLSNLVDWRNRHRRAFADPARITVKGQAAWFSAYQERTDDLMYVIETPSGHAVGCVSLYDIDRRAGTAELGRLLIGRAEDQGRGYASDACRAILGHAKDGLGLTRVYLRVVADNTPAITLYERLGFHPDASRDARAGRDCGSVPLLGMSAELAELSSSEEERPCANRRPLRVIVVHPGLTPSTYIRLLSPLRWLEARGGVRVIVTAETVLRPSRRALAGGLLRGSLEYVRAHDEACRALQTADVVVVQRSTSLAGLDVTRLAREAGAGIVYECDDDFLEIAPETESVGAYYNRPEVRRAFVEHLRGADIVTTTTATLEQAFNVWANDVRTPPNCVDASYLSPGPRRISHEAVVVGYAGTVTHGADFACVSAAVRRILDEYSGRMRAQFMGFIPDELAGRPEVEFIPYTEDYAGFLGNLSRADWSFAIAPLADLPANRGKTDNKYREYGACGIPAVYSASTAYSGSVVDGRTGLLVEHTEQGWYEGLKKMAEDVGLRERIAVAAREDVLARYTVAGAARAWLDVLHDAAAARRAR
jgi:RimJ/RimL family protein N-acetyltransferase/glycosyltransferase involved in cell wall biosynthesis